MDDLNRLERELEYTEMISSPLGGKKKKEKKKLPKGFYKPLNYSVFAGALYVGAGANFVLWGLSYVDCAEVYSGVCDHLEIFPINAAIIGGIAAVIQFTSRNKYRDNLEEAAKSGVAYPPEGLNYYKK